MSERELSPCPFCGQPDGLSFERFSDEDWHIECMACGACSSQHATQTEAAAAWNAVGRLESSEPELQAEDALLDALIEELKQAAWLGDNAADRVMAAEDALHRYIAELRAVPPAGSRAPDGWIVRRDGELKGRKGGYMLACLGEIYTQRHALEHAVTHEGSDIEVEVLPVYFGAPPEVSDE